MEKIKYEPGIIRAILMSLLTGYAVTILGLFLLAFLLLQFQLSEDMVEIGIVILYILSSLSAGYLVGKQLRNRKFIWGLFTGLSYYLILLVISIIAHRQLGAEPREIITTFLICVGSGMLGGMIS